MSRGLLGLILGVVVIGVAAALTVTSLTSTSITVPRGVFPTTSLGRGGGGPVTPAAPNSVGRAALTSACNADAESVENAVQLYLAQTGAPPANIAALASASTANGQAGGPWLRSVPSTVHYTIYVDSKGNVGIFPARADPSGLVPSSADFAQHPDLCASVPS